MIIAGIDEAGRGPAIGPLVMAIACIDPKDEDKLKKLGVKDSKLLTPEQRERMLPEIRKLCRLEIVKISPEEIDSAVFSDETNLNWLEADHAILMLNKMRPDKAFIDCPSTNQKAYKDYIYSRLKYKPELVVEHKADYKYVIVGAASIAAKVTRDHEIAELKKKFNVDFGSGYPSDPKTAQFIRDNNGKYPFFRKSWACCRGSSDKETQKKLSGF